MIQYSHLHVHSQYSLLDGSANIKELAKKAKNDNMKAISITDHGNMFGAFQFASELYKYNIKPILGCEFYLVKDRNIKSFTKNDPDIRYHQILLAKNVTGYQNIIKLCSLGYIDGLYNKWPRIDKSLIRQYHEGLIATTCCMNSEISKSILSNNLLQAENIFKWWLSIFEDDYYIELQRHNIEGQNKINHILIQWSKKYNVKVIATNDVHYTNKDDSDSHDSLLCINTGALKKTKIGRGKNYRFGFPNDEFYFKTQNEMMSIFNDIPEALDNTQDIVDKIQIYDLKRNITLPNFLYPKNFNNSDDYLEYLTLKGAENRYKYISSNVRNRINFELLTIKKMGFSGYFLIIHDCIKASIDMGVMVGPGRGSAAGSIVSYCIGITNIDPIKYNLLFERFLNPDRVNMPDIDIDFDNEGRQKIIDYVVKKYGYYQVAQIITYGSMAAKMSIKDVARVMELPVERSNYLSKLIPDKLGTSLKEILLNDNKKLKLLGYSYEEIDSINKIKNIYRYNNLSSSVLKHAQLLEGSVRNTGIHAAGIIIAPKNITNYIPVCTTKDSKYLITQYDGKIIENIGLLKMDFLGLKTLSIIKDTIKMINNKFFDINSIPLNDKKTFLLFQNGMTNSIFQFESLGMQKYLKQLKPDKIEDLIAMNALYRPGPMEYIPNFIKRKHGLEKISYYFPEMAKYLSDTYGIIIYQEQVMQLSQQIAGFSKYEADRLRKAMSKKTKNVLLELYNKYIKGCKKLNRNIKICNKIWNDLQSFALYAFNKSHSTCYAILSYQTAYLKAHFTPQFMASVLNVQINIDKISFIIQECMKNNIIILGPDINESNYKFSVNKNNNIRFGLMAIKGLGMKAVENIIEERNKNGLYKNIFDFAKRTYSRVVNKKSYESLVYSGSFDCFNDITREQFFAKKYNSQYNVIELLVKLSNDYQSNKINKQGLLFDNNDVFEKNSYFKIPNCNPWSLELKSAYEKDIIGIYISNNPLDKYQYIAKYICNCSIDDISTDNEYVFGYILKLYGIVNDVYITNDKYFYCKLVIEYYNSFITLNIYDHKINEFKHLLKKNKIIYIKMVVNHSKKYFNIKSYNILLINNIENTIQANIKKIIIKFDSNNLYEKKIKNIISKNVSDNILYKNNFVVLIYNNTSKIYCKYYNVNISINLINQLKSIDKLKYCFELRD